MLSRFALAAALLASATGCARPEPPRWERAELGDTDGCPGHFVFFDSGSAELTAQARAVLARGSDDIAEMIEAGGWLELYASADRLEGPSDAQALSRRRAEAVRDHLANLGVDPRHLRIVAWGAEHPLVEPGDPPAPLELAQNRHVQVAPVMPRRVFRRFFPPGITC